MKLFTVEYEKSTNTIYGSAKVVEVAIVTFSYASTKGSGKRKNTTRIIIIKRSNAAREHFRRWASLKGFCKATLIQWTEYGIAWVRPQDLLATNNIGRVILQTNEHLTRGVGIYNLANYSPNQWIVDESVQMIKKLVAYSYVTVRNTERRYEKIVICFKEESPEETFNRWIKEYNSNYDYRELRNVKILCDSKFISAI